MVTDAPLLPNTMERHRQKRDAPVAVQGPFIKSDSKNNLAQQGPDEVAERPRRGWDTSGTKNEVTNPLDMTMREKYTGFSCWNYR